MKTYSPTERHVTMEADPDGEWVFIEDHLAVVAENALKMKGLEVKLEKLERVVNQIIDPSLMPADATHYSLLDEGF